MRSGSSSLVCTKDESCFLPADEDDADGVRHRNGWNLIDLQDRPRDLCQALGCDRHHQPASAGPDDEQGPQPATATEEHLGAEAQD